MTESILATAERADRQRALRALLATPLMSAAGPDAAAFALVRRHARWLREWLARHPGWHLHIEGEVVRLRKTPGDLTDATRAARDPEHGVPFTRRRYVIWCLSLAALERSERQTTLGRLADDVQQFVGADPALAAAGIVFDLSTHDQRRDLVHVVRLLLDLAVLVRIHGQEQQFLDGRGDVLYTIVRPVLAATLNVRRSPSSIEETGLEERMALITTDAAPDTAEARNRAIRTRLFRVLLDDPVLYYDRIDADAAAYLPQQRGHITRQIEEATGLVTEARREGIAMVDDGGDLTDVGLPEEGTEGHLALLLAEHLAGHARRAPGEAVSLESLHRHTRRLVDQHRAHWRKAVTQDGGEIAATEMTLERLAALRLVRRVADGVVPLPAIARYGVRAPIAPRRRSRATDGHAAGR